MNQPSNRRFPAVENPHLSFAAFYFARNGSKLRIGLMLNFCLEKGMARADFPGSLWPFYKA
jgi:hypothetical protein